MSKQKNVRVQTGYEITPEIASILLQRSKRKNVPVKPRKIQQYAEDMRHGRWDENNSQAISIDWNEDIVNGHQRLMACVEAGVPFRTVFITGVPPETFTSEDTGRSRDAGHYFAMLGEPYYVSLASSARALYLWERGRWQTAAGSAAVVNINNEDLKATVDRRPALREAAYFVNSMQKAIKGRFNGGYLGALWVLTKNHPKHGQFWSELVDRVGGTKSSPAWQLNRRIDNAKAAQARLTGVTVLALLTKAWNFYAAGETKELVYYPRETSFPEPLTDLKPALLPPAGPDNEVKASTDKMTVRPPAKTVARPRPERKKQPKAKGPRLRGGLDR